MSKSTETSNPLGVLDVLSELSEGKGLSAAVKFTPEAENFFEVKQGTLRFYFANTGFIFASRVDLHGNGGHLNIAGDMGILPYSGQSAFLRSCLLSVIRRADLMRHCRFTVEKNQHILLTGDIQFNGTERECVFAALVRLLIDCRPHVILFRECLSFLPRITAVGDVVPQ